jgi:hypothetical protein
MGLQWIKEDEAKLWEEINNKIEKYRLWYLLWSTPEQLELSKQRKELNEDNRKLAYIYIGKTHKMCYIDNKNMKAYKMEGMYNKTWIPIKDYKFDRWCTSFDT